MRWLLLVPLLLAACISRPMTPEQAREHKLRAHCADIGRVAASQHRQQNSLIDAQPGNVSGGFYAGVARGMNAASTSRTAQNDCLIRHGLY